MNDQLLGDLQKVRDSTFRNAAQLRMMIDNIVTKYKAGDYEPKDDHTHE